MGEMFAGRYELVDVLGEGGMGTVWRVWDHRDGRYRAAKVLTQADSVALLRFVRESSWRIDHPHVVVPLSWAGEDDRVLFTMDIVRGGSLSTVLADHGVVDPGWGAVVIDQVLAALAAVHAAGIVHRDVKPANILLDATGTGSPYAHLTDFGIAVSRDQPRLTRTHEAVGTRGYLAPEAAAGADPDPRQDLYSVGVMLRAMFGDRAECADLAARLTGPVDARPVTAVTVREELAAIRWVDGLQSEPVEVFDQVPPLPVGWQEHGPSQERPPPVPARNPQSGPAPDRRHVPDATRAFSDAESSDLVADPEAPTPVRRGGSSRVAVAVAVVLALAGAALIVAALVLL